MARSTANLRFAVIGFGRRGRYHMESLEAMEDATVRCVAVSDPRAPTPEEEERFGRSFYHDYRQLLANTPDLDFVLVASYAVDHVEHALAALQRGIPVFLEKAVAFSWEQTVELYHEVVRHQYPLFVGYNLRRFPATLAMKRIIDEGSLGRIQSVLGHINTGNRWSQGVWERFRTPPSSTLVEGKLTHDTDTIQHCLGAEVVDCTATITRNIWTEGDDRPMTAGDVCSISGLLSNGVLYTFHLTTAGPDYERRYIVNGTEGQLEVVMHTVRPGQPRSLGNPLAQRRGAAIDRTAAGSRWTRRRRFPHPPRLCRLAPVQPDRPRRPALHPDRHDHPHRRARLHGDRPPHRLRRASASGHRRRGVRRGRGSLPPRSFSLFPGS